MKIAALRIDIDTKKGLDKGVPLLLDLFKKLDIKATFFINMGTLWNFNAVFSTLKRSSKEIASSKNKIGLVTKFGLVDFLKILIHHRQEVGNSNHSLIKQIIKNGHEVGLHGGADHSIWLRSYRDFSEEQIEKFIMPAYLSLKDCLAKAPKGFASPGFVSDNRLLSILSELDFNYVSDAFADKPYNIKVNSKNIMQIPITAGREVPLIEYYAAKGLNDSKIEAEISKIINKKEEENSPFIWYIHALFEPINKLRVIENLICYMKDKFDILTFEQILKQPW